MPAMSNFSDSGTQFQFHSQIQLRLGGVVNKFNILDNCFPVCLLIVVTGQGILPRDKSATGEHWQMNQSSVCVNSTLRAFARNFCPLSQQCVLLLLATAAKPAHWYQAEFYVQHLGNMFCFKTVYFEMHYNMECIL